MDFTSLSKTPKAATKKTVEVEAVPQPQTSGLTLFNSPDVGAALLAVSELQGARSFVFPVFEVTPGNTGGAFRPMRGTPEAIADELPQGSKPVPCIFLGYRTHLFAWPVGKSDDGEKVKPVWAVNVPCTAAQDAVLIAKAMEKYTYKNKAAKAAYDFEVSGVGHLRCQFQALVFVASMNAICVVQSVGAYKSWLGSCASARGLLDPNGGFIKSPVAASVATTEEKGAEAWKLHTLQFSPALGEKVDRTAIMKQFAAFGSAIQAEPQKLQEVMDWLACADHPITEDIRVKLNASLLF